MSADFLFLDKLKFVVSPRSLLGLLLGNLAVGAPPVAFLGGMLAWGKTSNKVDAFVDAAASIFLICVLATLFVAVPVIIAARSDKERSYSTFVRNSAVCLGILVAGISAIVFVSKIMNAPLPSEYTMIFVVGVLISGAAYALTFPAVQFAGAVYWQFAMRPAGEPVDWFWLRSWGGTWLALSFLYAFSSSALNALSRF